MSTIVINKKDFLEMLAKEIKDDTVIAFTSDLDGALTLNSKRKFKKLPFAFSADVFKEEKTVGDIMCMPTVAFVLMEPNQASQHAHDLLKDDEEAEV